MIETKREKLKIRCEGGVVTYTERVSCYVASNGCLMVEKPGESPEEVAVFNKHYWRSARKEESENE